MATSPRTPPQRSAERQALAAAIIFRDECRDRIDRLKQAQQRVEPWRDNAKLEVAREKLIEVEREAEQHAFDVAVGDTMTAPPPVDQVRAEIASAERDLATARRVRQQIDDELHGLERMQKFRVESVEAKARAVIAAEAPRSKAVTDLLAELQQARLRLLRLARVAHWLGKAGALPMEGIAATLWSQPAMWSDAVAPDERWQAALDALLIDPDAVVP